MFDEESIIRIVKPYGTDIVQTVLPTFIGGLIERKTKQQRTAEKIKAAVLGLEQDHQFCFKWNRMYEDFLKGRPSESKQKEKGVEYVRSVLGDDYRTFLGLPSGRDSNIRLLRPICKLMELLAMTKEDLRMYVLKVKDNRCTALSGTQGHRQTVTIEDLEVVKNALTRLKWLPPPAAPKRPREKADGGEEQTEDALNKRQKKSGRQSQKGKEGSRGKRGREVGDANEQLEDDAGEVRSGNQAGHGRGTGDDEYESPSQDMTNLRLPTPPQRRDYTPTPREKTPPVGFPQISKGAGERTTKKRPKNAKDLWAYRVLGAGPMSSLVGFGSWLDSDYVHGSGELGEFAFDDVQAGSIYAARLIGFHDAYKHHLGRDYLNSWIVLPLGDLGSLSALWTAVSELLNHRVLSLDDAALYRMERDRDSVECRRILKCGGIPLITNILEFPETLYPHACNAIEDYIPMSTEIISKTRIRKSLVEWIKESEDPLKVWNRFPKEISLEASFPVPKCVKALLDETWFWGEKSGQNLRYPRGEPPGMPESLQAIGNAMPRYYGEPSGCAQSLMLEKVSRRADVPGVYLGGNWTQRLRWKGDDPKSLMKGGLYEKRQSAQVEWLQIEAEEQVGTKRWVGVCGTLRNRSTPMAGAMLWSLLYRGQRLILLYGPNGSYKQTIAHNSPGHEYAWYNIRSCISDEGYGYNLHMFVGRTRGNNYIPGTFDALTKWPLGTLTPSTKANHVIVYFVLVNMFTDWTLAYNGKTWGIIAGHIAKLLSLPVFSYLPRVDTELSRDDLDNCVKVLAWTAPYAAVALNRCIESAAANVVSQQPWEDSITLKEAEDAIVTDVESEVDDSQTSSAMVATHVSNTYIHVDSRRSQEAQNSAAMAAAIECADPEANGPEEDSIEGEEPANKDEEVAGTVEQPETNVAGGKELAATHEVAEVHNGQSQGDNMGESDLAEMLQFTMDAVTAADISD